MNPTHLFTLALMIILSMGVQATEERKLQGRVTSYVPEKGRIVIDHKTYKIDREVMVHRSASLQINKLSMSFMPRQQVAFKIEQNSGDKPRISEIWVLFE